MYDNIKLLYIDLKQWVIYTKIEKIRVKNIMFSPEELKWEEKIIY